MVDYYAILEISRVATNTEIRVAYLQKCKEWHPDKNTGIDTTQIMQDINEARNVLLDPVKRTNYDRRYNAFVSYTAAQEQRNYNNEQNQRQKSRLNKLRYNKLKKRAAAFMNADPFMHKNYVDKIEGYSNKELIDLCVNWNSYAIGYVDLILIELHEKRNYGLDVIYSLVREKPHTVPGKVKKTDWVDWAVRLLFWLLLSLAAIASRQH